MEHRRGNAPTYSPLRQWFCRPRVELSTEPALVDQVGFEPTYARIKSPPFRLLNYWSSILMFNFGYRSNLIDLKMGWTTRFELVPQDSQSCMTSNYTTTTINYLFFRLRRDCLIFSFINLAVEKISNFIDSVFNKF